MTTKVHSVPKSITGDPDVSIVDIFARRPVDVPQVVAVDKNKTTLIGRLGEELFSLAELEDERSSSASMAQASVNVLRLPEGYQMDGNFFGLSAWVLNADLLLNGSWLALENIVMSDGGLVTIPFPPLAVTPEKMADIKQHTFFHIAVTQDPVTGKRQYLLDGKPVSEAAAGVGEPTAASGIVHRIIMGKQ